MKKLIAALAALAVLPAGRALAEDAPYEPGIHVAPYVGAFLPTGKLRDVLDDAALAGIAVSFDATTHLALVGSFSWAPTKLKHLQDGDLDLFQYDLGVQGQYPFHLGGGWTATPFLGAGIGGRYYRGRDVTVHDEAGDFLGYLSAGGTFAHRKLELSMTARDNISHYKGLGLGADDLNGTRNDLALYASVGYRF